MPGLVWRRPGLKKWVVEMRAGAEYRLVLEGFTPDTIPMARLAEYMQQLAKMLGQEAFVHFQRVENNCTALVSKIDRRDIGKVGARVRAIRSQSAPADAMKAFGTINNMVGEDGTTAVLRERSATIIRFPGTRPSQIQAFEVPDEGTVIGYLYMLSDARNEFHARIRLESGGTLMCTVTDEIAKKLREHLFEAVKVSGPGLWTRSPSGDWAPNKLDIKDVVGADSKNLRSIIDELRRLDIEWPEDAIESWGSLTDGGNQIQ